MGGSRRGRRSTRDESSNLLVRCLLLRLQVLGALDGFIGRNLSGWEGVPVGPVGTTLCPGCRLWTSVTTRPFDPRVSDVSRQYDSCRIPGNWSGR